MFSLLFDHSDDAKVDLLWLMFFELSNSVLEKLKSAHDLVKFVETPLHFSQAAFIFDLRFLRLYDQGLRYLNCLNLKVISFDKRRIIAFGDDRLIYKIVAQRVSIFWSNLIGSHVSNRRDRG